MPKEGDRVIFPDVGTFEDTNTGREVVGEITATDTIVDIEEGSNESLFGPDEGETRLELEDRGRTLFSELGAKTGRDTVEPGDVIVDPAERRQDDSVDPAAVHAKRSREARIADEAKDARVTTDKEQWASDPSAWDYPGVDTGPQFDETFDSDFLDF